MGSGENILGLVGDVRRERDVRKIVSRCLKHFGRIDILINNAASQLIKELRKSPKRMDDILDTNLKGCFLFCDTSSP